MAEPAAAKTVDQSSSPFRPDLLHGLSALVTGGGSGICFEIARQLGLHGAQISVMGRRKEVLDKAVAQLKAEGIKAFAVRGDVRKPGEVASAVANAVNEMGGLDILVNGAAGNFLATAEGLRPGGFRTVMEIDAIGTFNMCHACHDQLRKSGDGVILNISANLHLPATWYQIHASAAKAAVDSITRSLALEWGTYKIRSVGIAPGPIEGTPGLKKLAPGANKDAVKKMVQGMIPLGRLGQSVDIGYAAVFLCSPSASFISGSTLLVDGAQWLYQNQPVPRALVNRMSAMAKTASERKAKL